MHWQESTRLWIILPAVLRRLCTCLGGARRRWVRQCFNLKNKIGLENLFIVQLQKELLYFLRQVCRGRTSGREEGFDPVQLCHQAGQFFFGPLFFSPVTKLVRICFILNVDQTQQPTKQLVNNQFWFFFGQFWNNCCWEMESLEHSTPHGLTFVICSWCSSFELKS